MAIKIQDQTIIDNSQNINTVGIVTALGGFNLGSNDHAPRFAAPNTGDAGSNGQIFIGDKISQDTLNRNNVSDFGIFIGRQMKNLNQLTHMNSSFNVVIGEHIHNNSNFGRINDSVIVGYKAAKEVHDNYRSVIIGNLAGYGQVTTSGSNNGYGGYGGYSGGFTTTQPETANYCTYVGYKAGYDHTNGQNNICIGYNSGTISSPSGSIGTSSNTIVLGNSLIQNFYCADTSISSSDGRDKTDVEDFTAGLTFIESLRPVTYRWDKRSWYMPETQADSDLSVLDMIPNGTHKREKLHIGFIAQEMEEVEKAHGYANSKKDQLIVDLNEDNTAYGIKYERLVPVLVNAIKELKQEINDLKAQLN